MTEIVRSHTSSSTLCGFMNLPSPMNIKTCNDTLKKITSVYKEVANTSMHNTTIDLKFKQGDENVEISGTINENSIADIPVLGDVGRQKRGFSSLYGVVNLIASDSGNCVDYQVLTKTCGSCS